MRTYFTKQTLRIVASLSLGMLVLFVMQLFFIANVSQAHLANSTLTRNHVAPVISNSSTIVLDDLTIIPASCEISSVTQNYGGNGQPIISEDGQWGAFWSNADYEGKNSDGNIELFMAYVDPLSTTLQIIQITETKGNVASGFNLRPAINRSSSQVAFFSDQDPSTGTSCVGNNSDKNFEIFRANIFVDEANKAVSDSCEQVTDSVGGANLLPNFAENGQIIFAQSSYQTTDRLFNPFATTGRNGFVYLPIIFYRKYLGGIATPTHSGTINPTPIPSTSSYVLAQYDPDINPDLPVSNLPSLKDINQVVAGGETILEPAIDFSDRFIVFVSERNLAMRPDYQNAQQIFLYDLKTKQPFIQISQNNDPSTTVEHPAISRDGKKIVFIQGKKLYYVEQVSLNPLVYSDPIAIFTHGTVSEATINAEGTRLIFTAANLQNLSDRSKPDVYLYDLAGGGEHLLAIADALPDKWVDRTSSNPSISADGQTIVFASDNTKQVEVYLARCGTANLSLQKMANRTVVPGDVMNYSFVIQNRDDKNAISNVILEDYLPSELTFEANLSQGCSSRGQRVTCPIGRIGANQQTSFTFWVKVSSEITEGTIITNTARVYSGLPNGSVGSTATATTLVKGAKAILEAKATWPGLIQVNQPITYQLTIVNNGPSVATDAIFNDVLPANGQVIDFSGLNCTVNGSNISCPLGTLTPTQAITLTLVTSPISQAAIVTNTITLNSKESPQPVIETQKTEVIDTKEQLYVAVIEAQPDPVPLNATLTYFVSAINVASKVANGVDISYTIPPEAILAGSSFCGRDILPQLNGQILTFRVDRLDPGATVDCTISIQVTQLPPNDTLTSTIKVSSINVPGNSATHQMMIDRSGDLRLEKTTNARFVTSGTLFNYTLSISNNNPVPVQVITLTDTLPNGLDLVNVPASPGVRVMTQTNSVIWLIPEIAPYTQQDYLITVRVIDANAIANLLSPIITNTAVVEAQQDRYLVNNTASYTNIVVGTIGGHVWHDMNANGLQDSSELTVTQGLTMTVKLYDSLNKVVATQTVIGGVYEFNNIESGDYTLEFSLPTPFDQFSPAHQGNDDTLDNDVDSQTRRTKPFRLPPGRTLRNWDAGVYHYAKINTYVWEDIDGNGVQNEDSLAAMNEVIVEVYTNTKTSPLMTGGTVNGYYTATNLVPGTYYLKLIKPTDFADFTWSDVITDDALDSDVDRISGQTPTMTLVSGEVYTRTDGGLYRLGSIQNSNVFEDFDIDGIKDPRELRLPSVSVALWWQKPGGALIPYQSTSTNNDGFYNFTKLPPGFYKLEIDKLAGYEFSTPPNNCRPIPQRDNSNNTFLVKSNQNNIVCEAGLYQPVGGVGGTIIADMGPPPTDAGNGIQNSGEIGIANVTVRLFNTTGTAISTTTTNSAGNYVFNGLIPGRYYFQFINPDPTKYVFSPANQGGNPEIDCDGDISTGTTNPFDLNPGQSDFSWDGCFQQVSSLKGLAWLDSNQNGIRENTETAYLPNVTVKLYNALGNLVAQTTTTTLGYQFDHVTPGDYYLTFTSAGGYLCSPANVTDDMIDSDATGTPPCQTSTFRLTPGEVATSWDVGMFPPSVLVAGRVWHDLNGDGIQNNGQNGLIEPGLPGTMVSLVSSANSEVVASQMISNSDGLFNFVNPAVGNYYLAFTSPLTSYCYSPKKVLGSDPSNDSDVDVPSCGISTTKTDNFAVVANQIDTHWGAGLYQKASISGYVWYDSFEADGVKDTTNEGNMPTPITVQLLKSGVQVGLQTVQGVFTFANLLPGSYQLQFSQPSGYQYSPPSASSPNIGPFALDSSQVLTDQNKGYYKTSNIQVLVWDDKDADGQKDGGEGNLSINVPVTLYRNGVAVETVNIANTHTFLNLTPSPNYVLQFDEAGTYKLSPPPTSTGTISVTLGGGTIQQGYYQKVTITGYVWEDINGNSVKDGEGNLPNAAKVDIELHDANGLVEKLNNQVGSFQFSPIIPLPGYWIEFQLPSGYTFTKWLTGTAFVTDFSSPIIQGYQPLGDLVVQLWHDLNGNGTKEITETDVSFNNRSIDLIYQGNVIDSQNTNNQGKVTFPDLFAGNYQIDVQRPNANSDGQWWFSPVNYSDDNTSPQTFSITFTGSYTQYVGLYHLIPTVFRFYDYDYSFSSDPNPCKPSFPSDNTHCADNPNSTGRLKDIPITITVQNNNMGAPVRSAANVLTDNAGRVGFADILPGHNTIIITAPYSYSVVYPATTYSRDLLSGMTLYGTNPYPGVADYIGLRLDNGSVKADVAYVAGADGYSAGTMLTLRLFDARSGLGVDTGRSCTIAVSALPSTCPTISNIPPGEKYYFVIDNTSVSLPVCIQKTYPTSSGRFIVTGNNETVFDPPITWGCN